MVSPRLWRSVTALLLLTITGVLALALTLAFGAADPPFAGKLIWDTQDTSGWSDVSDNTNMQMLQAPSALPAVPFTLQLAASNSGAPNSAWGIWLDTTTGRQVMLVDNQGYYSVSDTPRPRWAEFIHLRTGRNTVYLNVAPDGAATLRLNREVAWTGSLRPRNTWGIVIYRAPVMTWDTLQLYAPGGHS
jgi:hypothetical protein